MTWLRSCQMLVRGACAALLLGLIGAAAAGAVTYHDNVVEMPLTATGYTVVTATYTITDFSVTSGEDPSGNITKGLAQTYTGNAGSMSYKIGRKGSSSVAAWFTKRVTSSRNTFNDDPGELNFAFIGTLSITLTGGALGTNKDTYTLADIAIAQGSVAGVSNNWWFGGKNCKYTSGNNVSCSGTSTAQYEVHFYFRRGGSGNPVNEVNLFEIEYEPYTLFPLQPTYAGESTGCVWQPLDLCPPFVMYYTDTQARALVLTVNNNLLYNSLGGLFDTSGADSSHSGHAAIFVMDKYGRIYASNANKHYMFHHSTILGGASVASAGELVVERGVLKSMTNCSGHYKPPKTAATQLLESLHRQGYTTKFAAAYC